MKTLNKVQLIGHLGRDVELRYMPSGEAVANLAIATSSEWKDRDSGERQQATEWHRCVAFGKLAELIAQYCAKGSNVYIEGKLRTRKWADKDGVDRYTTEVVADEFINFDKRERPGEPAREEPTDGQAGEAGQGEHADDAPAAAAPKRTRARK